jgi:hypothetical protein
MLDSFGPIPKCLTTHVSYHPFSIQCLQSNTSPYPFVSGHISTPALSGAKDFVSFIRRLFSVYDILFYKTQKWRFPQDSNITRLWLRSDFTALSYSCVLIMGDNMIPMHSIICVISMGSQVKMASRRYTRSQNGVSERKMCTLVEVVRCMLKSA